MAEEIKVSIITPSFNQGKFIEETIQSVLNQNYKNVQYILVDGGSTDNTMEIVEKYRGKIDIVIHEKDNGQSNAINKGFKLASGDLVGWINSDDILYPECVSEIVSLYKQNTSGVIFYSPDLDIIDSKSNVFKTTRRLIPDRNHLLHKHYSVVQQGSFYRSDILKEFGYLDEDIHYCMDLDLWLKLLNHGGIHALSNGPYSAFRLWEDTKTSTGKEKFLKNIKEVLQKHGAKYTSKTIQRIEWYTLKALVKRLLNV